MVKDTQTPGVYPALCDRFEAVATTRIAVAERGST